MTPELVREFKRKAFHLLSLVHLGAFWALGQKNAAIAVLAFTALSLLVETFRLRNRGFNNWLINRLGGIHREKEKNKMSGIVWTSLGCFGTIVLFGEQPRVVSAGILFLALGDGVAALAGRAWGVHKWPALDGKKSLEGSAACFLACLISAISLGINLPAAALGALSATIVEILPVPIDDNLWLPIISAAVVSTVI
ncbi:MAG: hypothetical protein COB53_02225 [Elusimicrobia bacterium]|nr:MAG: hypothetical protein COB53_02225 [Elusimicrobiota bacterium]